MAVPYHVAATALKTIIDGEFTDLNLLATHDCLHESLGTNGLVVGISPDDEQALPNDYNTAVITILVQWYDMWQKMVDPTQSVDPFDITAKADRFKRAVESFSATNAGTSEIWYFNVPLIRYPRDPTGNKTRFEAVIRAYGDNTAGTVPAA